MSLFGQVPLRNSIAMATPKVQVIKNYLNGCVIGLSITLLRTNQNQPNFFKSKFDKKEIGGKLKNRIFLKMWGRETGKVGKFSQNGHFQ